MKYFRNCLALVALACIGLPVSAAQRHDDLDQWLVHDLLPFVRKQLGEYPRFRGESLRFVVMENGNPQALSNALTLHIRDQLREVAADIPAVRVAWQPDDPHYARNKGPGGLDCTRSEVHYLIGVETVLTDTGLLAVEVRALDVEDRSLVAEFTRQWQGRVTRSQFRDFRRSEIDHTFRGEREAPYEESQGDLLAAHLAHDLGCSLLRQTDAEYVITENAGGVQHNPLSNTPVSNMLELVSNNLAQYSSLQFTATVDGANSVIDGKAHRIDDDLYQYWVTVHAKDPASELKALSASAYVRLPERFAVAAAYAEPPPELTTQATILDSLKIVELQGTRSCPTGNLRRSAAEYGRRYGDAQADCFALQVRTGDDAVVFFLNHQLNNGLVRLSDGGCERRAKARIARSGEALQFPLPPDSLPTPEWSAGETWRMQPDLDTYYAVAASDTQAARALSRHIETLPKRCTASVRPGLEGHALRQWMAELESIIEDWGPAIDWRNIRVKNVY